MHRQGVLLSFDLSLIPQGGLRGGKSCDGDTVGAAGDVGQADLVAEGDGARVAALLAADAQLDIRAGLTAQLCGHLDQTADACPTGFET